MKKIIDNVHNINYNQIINKQGGDKMKLRKYSKIIIALLVIATICTSLNIVLGTDVGIPTAGTVAGGAQTAANNIVGAVITMVQIVAFAAAVIMLMFLGIKYITASPDGKAEIKKSATQYVVGAVILFAASGILQIVKNFAVSNVTDKAA